jgi:hypothetical protein
MEFNAYVVLTREWGCVGDEQVDVFTTFVKAREFIGKLRATTFKDYRIVDMDYTLWVFEQDEFNNTLCDEDICTSSDWKFQIEILPTYLDRGAL